MPGSRRRSILPIGLFFLACSSLSTVLAQDRSHQPPIRQIELDHVDFDSCSYNSPELAATAVTPFCKSFTFLCHVRCLQRGDLQNPGNDPSAPSSAQKVEINRCNHVPNTRKMQVLCLCNNGVDLTAEIDYALEGVVDIAAAGGDGTGAGEAGKIREVVYAATLTVTEYRTVIVTVAAAAQTAVPTSSIVETLNSPNILVTGPTTENANESADKGNLLSGSDQTVIRIKPVEIENKKTQENEEVQENEEASEDEDALKVGTSTNVSPPQLNEGPEGSFNEASWASDPDAYQDPYLEEEFIVPIDDQEQVYYDAAEVEAEEETGPLSNGESEDDIDLEKIDQSTNFQTRKHKSKDGNDNDDDEDDEEEDDDRHKHKVELEDMFPPFDVESEPLPKHSHHKHSHDDDKKNDQQKKHHSRDRDEHKDDSEQEDDEEDEDEILWLR